jgi:hypothetical protein
LVCGYDCKHTGLHKIKENTPMTLQDLSMTDLLTLDELYWENYQDALIDKDPELALEIDRKRDAIGSEFERREGFLFPQIQ